jgi:ABC-type multidrug transport system ATPase subunit
VFQEEAEVCCQTIAIMAKGRMRCIGAPTRLKQLYGCGYKLSIISNNLLRAQELINLILPANEHTKVLYSFQSVRKYGFVPTSDELANIFEQLVANATEYEIKTWGVSQTTLDEIFANIVSQDEARG